MKGVHLMHTARVVLLAILCVFFFAQTTGAEDAEPGLIAKSFRVTVKLDRFLQFEDAYRQHLEWHGKNNDSWAWHTWQVVNGENLGEYIVRTHGHNWADFDRDAAMRQSEWADVLTYIAPHLERMVSTLELFEPQLSNWPADIGQPALVELTRFELDPKGVSSFRDAIAKIHDVVMEKAPDRHYGWLRIVNGSRGPTMILAIPRSNWADFEPDETSLWSLMEAVYGQAEAAAIQETIATSIRDQQSSVVAYRPDLSYQPKP
jgi:hypothetical protein